MKFFRHLSFALAMMLVPSSMAWAHAGGGALKSQGVYVCQNEAGDEIRIDSSDFYYLEAALGNVKSYKDSLSSSAYNVGRAGQANGSYDGYSVVRMNHSHKGDPSVYGGCYTRPVYIHKCYDCYEKAYGHYEEVSHGGWSNSEGVDYGDLGTTMEWVQDGVKTVHVGGDNYLSGYDLGCNKTPATIEYQKYSLGFVDAVPDSVSSGAAVYYDADGGDSVQLDGSDVASIESGLRTVFQTSRLYILDRFLAGCRAYGNSHGISEYKYGRHAHDAGCYTDGRLICDEVEGQSVDSIELFYGGSYSYHIHRGTAESHFGTFADDTILHQVSNPGGCFVSAGHEHTDACVHSHGDSCIETCEVLKGATYVREGETKCPACKADGAKADFYSVKHGACGRDGDEWPVALECGSCGYRQTKDSQDVADEKEGELISSHTYMTCAQGDGAYTCNDQPVNTWRIGCGKSVTDVESVS